MLGNIKVNSRFLRTYGEDKCFLSDDRLFLAVNSNFLPYVLNTADLSLRSEKDLVRYLNIFKVFWNSVAYFLRVHVIVLAKRLYQHTVFLLYFATSIYGFGFIGKFMLFPVVAREFQTV